MFLEWFQEWEVEVLYIVEDVKNSDNYKGVPFVSRKSKDFKYSDCMIICDRHISLVRQKLKTLGYKGLVSDHYEMIEPFS